MLGCDSSVADPHHVFSYRVELFDCCHRMNCLIDSSTLFKFSSCKLLSSNKYYLTLGVI